MTAVGSPPPPAFIGAVQDLLQRRAPGLSLRDCQALAMDISIHHRREKAELEKTLQAFVSFEERYDREENVSEVEVAAVTAKARGLLAPARKP